MDNKISKEELEHFIQSTYKLEGDLEKIKLQQKKIAKIFLSTIHMQPNAIWVLNQDNTIYLQNSKSLLLEKELKIEVQNFSQEEQEITLEEKSFIFQSSIVENKTIVTATDITKSKHSERLISMGKMASHLAHEIRNPIAAISLLIPSLFQKVDFKTKPTILNIKKSISRIQRIIDSTLHFTKEVNIKPSFFNIDDLVDEFELIISEKCYTKKINFIFNLPKIKIYGDINLLSIVFQNLIINAIDAIEENNIELGEIKISLIQKQNFNHIKIRDNGIDFENIDKLFEAFQTTKKSGHGLGLALSKLIIEAHNGTIKPLSQEKAFLITLPKKQT